VALRILITNSALAGRGGSELYVRDLATELLKRGHTPIAYSAILGEVARELRSASIEVVDDLDQLSAAPDVIHGHHHLETLTALLRYPGVPAINFCHSSTHWSEGPLVFPRVRRCVAVDHACRDRVLGVRGIKEENVCVILSFVDLERFKPRVRPLPSRPQRALVFSNYANEETHLPLVREACKRAGIELDAIGAGADNGQPEPEKILGYYDLVFAKGRCALEALAVGAAVILCDASGLGPMVTAAEFDNLRPLNFGFRTLSNPLKVDLILREVDRYDADDAAAVSRLVRETAGHQGVVDQLIDLYYEVIREYSTTNNHDAELEGRAAAAYLRQLRFDFARHGAASMRLRERLRLVPVVGRLGIRWIESITGKQRG
jgi:Glycosyltransferase Family 4